MNDFFWKKRKSEKTAFWETKIRSHLLRPTDQKPGSRLDHMMEFASPVKIFPKKKFFNLKKPPTDFFIIHFKWPKWPKCQKVDGQNVENLEKWQKWPQIDQKCDSRPRVPPHSAPWPRVGHCRKIFSKNSIFDPRKSHF